MTYSEKLKDPRWQKLRLKILERDQFKCTLCSDEKTTLHVHHEEYKKDPWDADIDKLKTLCSDCHFIIEFLKTNKRWEVDYVSNIVKIFTPSSITFYLFMGHTSCYILNFKSDFVLLDDKFISEEELCIINKHMNYNGQAIH
jgi:hypothetical protein